MISCCKTISRDSGSELEFFDERPIKLNPLHFIVFTFQVVQLDFTPMLGFAMLIDRYRSKLMMLVFVSAEKCISTLYATTSKLRDNESY